ERERRQAILEQPELVDDLRREQVRARAHDLAQRDERGPERRHRLAEHEAAERVGGALPPRAPDEQHDAEPAEAVHQAAHEEHDQEPQEVEEVARPAQHDRATLTQEAVGVSAHVSAARAAAARPQVVSAATDGPILARTRTMNVFKADIEEIRRRATEKMEEGAVTASYRADRERVIEVLNEVLATETVCTLRYRSHYFRAKGVHAPGIEDEFLEHANEEQAHADRVAKRI